MRTRREFLSAASAASAAALYSRRAAGASPAPITRSISMFSKHLAYLGYQALAETAAEAGFDGIDLTVRPGGHVLPERVAEDLPRAWDAARTAGVSISMITTTITSVRDPQAEAILRTAGRLGIRDYRMGWIAYDRARGITGTLQALAAPLRELAALSESSNIRGGYQNHVGDNIGGPLWDAWLLLKDVGSPWLGFQYDIRHAVMESGGSWRNALRLVASMIHTLDVKDGQWTKTDAGWQPVTVPLGEGAVDLGGFLRLLSELRVSAPISMHFEYPLPEDGGAAERRKAAVASMRRDRERLRAALAEAEAGA